MLDEFRTNLLEELRAEADSGGAYLQTVFFETVVEQMEDVGNTSGVQTAYYRSDRPFVCLDGIAVDEVEGRLDLMVLDLHATEDEPPTLTRTRLEYLLAGLDRFKALACGDDPRKVLEPTSPECDAALRIAEMAEAGARVRLLVITDARLSDRVRELDDREIADGARAAVAVWDISRICSVMGPGGSDVIDIDLRKYAGGGIPCLPAHVNDEEYESYLVVVPGQVLADVYGAYGPRLLEQNVRSFLQARGKVNKGIRKTLHDEPRMFFAYNNGITATAENVEVEYGDGGYSLRSVRNLQIVNGGQTTASIFTARARDAIDLSAVFVQMKLAVIPSETVEHVVPRISRYANTQNKVSEADLFSNHPFHVRLEEFSRRIWAPPKPGSAQQTRWFYERARGQYADARSKLSAAQRRRFDREHPRQQMFTKTDLAKFEMVWLPAPHLVSLGAQKNFAAFAERVVLPGWSRNDADFNERYFKGVIARALIFRETERIVGKAAWYSSGYRANIVAYALARIAKAIGDRKARLDFDRVYANQSVPDDLRQLIDGAGERMQEVLLSPPEGIRNISEWAKKEGCWERAQLQPVDLAPIASLLVDEEEEASRSRDARRVRGIDGDIELQAWALSVSPDQVRVAIEHARMRDLGTPTEISVAEKKLSGKILTGPQCRPLRRLMERVRDDGGEVDI